MSELFKQCLSEALNYVPSLVYWDIFAALIVGAAVVLSRKNIRQKGRVIAGLLLVLYVILVYSNTVIFRPTGVMAGHNFKLFWSYEPFLKGEGPVSVDAILNVLMFLPVGVLYGAASRKSRAWKALLVGACISVSIEALQFFLHRGFSEIDDVLHNALGCLIGWLLYRVVAWGVGRIVDPS